MLQWSYFTIKGETDEFLTKLIKLDRISFEEIKDCKSKTYDFNLLRIVSPFDFKQRFVYEELGQLFQMPVETYLADNYDLITELFNKQPLPLNLVSSVLDPGKLYFGKLRD